MSARAMLRRAARLAIEATLGAMALAAAGCNSLIGLEVGTSAKDECELGGADVVFCSGFEEETKAIWDDTDMNPDGQNDIVADPGPFGVADNHVMRISGTGDLVKELPSQHDRLYIRYYLRFDPSFDLNAGHAGVAIHAGIRDMLGNPGPPAAEPFFTVLGTTSEGRPVIRAIYAGMYMHCDATDCYFDVFPCDVGEACDPAHLASGNLPAIAAGRWLCVELAVDPGPPGQESGSVEMFVDSKAVGPFGHLLMRTASDLRMGILWVEVEAPSEQPGAVFYDNIVVSTSPIGCIGSGP